MNEHIYNEQSGLHYTLYDDVHLPDLAASKNEQPTLGRYGMMRWTYLKEH